MILNLFYKPKRHEPMMPVAALEIAAGRISGAVPGELLRQVLIVPRSTLDKFRLAPGDLRENILLDDKEIGPLHDLPSGTVLDINGVRIRLTVHCEPCQRIAHLVSISAIRHYRGYLGTFVSDGTIRLGDAVRSRGVQYERIPYELKDRIVWYLGKQAQPVEVTRLVRDIGLPLAACRAVPNIVKGIPHADKMIIYKNRARARPQK
jgi:hypothetical protein